MLKHGLNNLLLAIILTLAACSSSEDGPVSGGEYDYVALAQIVSELGEIGDLSAQAIIASGVVAELEPESFPTTLYMVNEMNVASGLSSAERTVPTAYKTGDSTLRAYIAEQGLSEEAFLNHPKLELFVKSFLLKEEVEVGGTEAGAEQTLQAQAGNNLRVSSTGAGKIFVNDVALNRTCILREPGGKHGLLCSLSNVAIDFDWN